MIFPWILPAIGDFQMLCLTPGKKHVQLTILYGIVFPSSHSIYFRVFHHKPILRYLHVWKPQIILQFHVTTTYIPLYHHLIPLLTPMFLPLVAWVSEALTCSSRITRSPRRCEVLGPVKQRNEMHLSTMLKVVEIQEVICDLYICRPSTYIFLVS